MLGREILSSIKAYEPGKPTSEVQRELGLERVIKLASNENPLGPSKLAVEAMISALSGCHYYPDPNSYYLKEALAGRLGVKPSEIVLGAGADEVIYFVCQAFLNNGDEVVLAKLTFPIFTIAAQVMGGQVITSEMRNFTYDLKALLAAITPKTKLIFIANPNNPTGTVVTQREVDEFLEEVPDGVVTILDEAYYEYVVNPSFPDSLSYVRAGKNIIVLRTFSKIYGLAGIRVGYGLAKEQITQLMNKVRPVFTPNILGQVAALAALEDKEHFRKSLELNEAGKKYLYKEFTRLGLNYCLTETNFIFVDCGVNSRFLFQELLKQGVIIRPVTTVYGNSYARITIGSQEDNEILVDALELTLNGLRT
ncbi:MAG: histidinol-phosphate transaminase [Candidatus Tectomicrobia bacterium]|uniref:Histidinol-phosphate aminotransferase n=1 Tax=Tectimicrobiota bacterium TaxID=2528274 RepID=A0A933GKR5_UNCTE|nr:histidinol-phosphate transaminase [Candidatus Tectomicrobia bacterium]